MGGSVTGRLRGVLLVSFISFVATMIGSTEPVGLATVGDPEEEEPSEVLTVERACTTDDVPSSDD